jgi:cytochrome c-type biogenesis protein CcmH/NrfG
MRWNTASLTRAVSIAATSGPAFLVPLLYVPSLAFPFTGPKDAVLQIAAALGFGALLLRYAAWGRRTGEGIPGGFGTVTMSPVWRRPGRTLVWGALLVLGSLALSAAAASRSPIGAPYALAASLRWISLFGIACGVAAGDGGPGARIGLFQAVTASAAVVSVIGLLQHIDLVSLPIPVISTPGSTFGNRNLAGEAVALSLPLGFGAFSLAASRLERRAIMGALALQLLYLAATRARGAWFGGALGMATVAILNRKSWSLSWAEARSVWLPWVTIVVVALLVAFFPGRSNPRYAADAKRLAGGLDVVGTSFDPESTALRTRVGLWRRSLTMSSIYPFIGIGPGNWPVVFPSVAEPGASTDGVLTFTLAPRHAHFDLLECLTETGLIGLASLLVLGIGVTAAIRKGAAARDAASRIVTVAAAGTLVALLAVGVTGFPLAMPATLTLAGLALGLISSNGPESMNWQRDPGRRQLPIWVAAVVTVAMLGFASVYGYRRLAGAYLLGTAERALHEDPGPAGAAVALTALHRAQIVDPGSFRVALRVAHAELRFHNITEATRACDAALTIEPFSPNAWATLAAVQLDGGDPPSARNSAARSLQLLNDSPFALFVKAKAADAVGDQSDAAATWARLGLLARGSGNDPETTRSARELLQTWRGPTPLARSPTENR